MRRNPQQERSKRTAQRIVEAAAHLFEAQGYRATTTNDIARAAQVSIGSLYQYFRDKDEILGILYHEHLDTAGPAMVQACRANDDVAPGAWSAALVAALVDANDSRLAVVLYHSIPPPGARRRVDAVVAEMAAATESHLRRWGIATPGSRAQVLVVAALAVVHEAVVRHPKGRKRRDAAAALEHLLVASLQP